VKWLLTKAKLLIAKATAFFTESLRHDLDEQAHRLKLLELAYAQLKTNFEAANEIIVSLRVRLKEVRDECIEDGLHLKRELTDAKREIEALKARG